MAWRKDQQGGQQDGGNDHQHPRDTGGDWSSWWTQDQTCFSPSTMSSWLFYSMPGCHDLTTGAERGNLNL